MSGTYIRYPSPGGVSIYDTIADFPATATDGTLAVAADSSFLYVYDTISGWQVVASPGGASSIALTSSHVLVGNSSNVAQDRVMSGDVSITNTGVTTVAGLSSKMTNPMTTGGDLIYGGASGTPTRLANGSAGQWIRSAGSTNPPAYATGLQTLLGNNGSITSASGFFGEEITAQANAGIVSGAQTSFVSITLTAGIWRVSGSGNDDTGGISGGWDQYLYVKGANTGTYAYDHFQFRPGTIVSGAPVSSATFHERTVQILSGDADKTVSLKAQSVTGNTTMYGSLNAFRIS